MQYAKGFQKRCRSRTRICANLTSSPTSPAFLSSAIWSTKLFRCILSCEKGRIHLQTPLDKAELNRSNWTLPEAPLVVGIVQEPVKWVNDDRSTTVDQTQLTTSIPRTFNPPLTPMVRHQSVLSRVTCVEDNLVRPSAQTRRQASRFQPKVSRLLRSLKDEPK